MNRIEFASFISIALIIVFCVTLITAYYFPVYPDEIQVRFWLSRLPYDFPEKISGAPACLSSFFQPIPETMYLPGIIDWLLHGNVKNIPVLRQVGIMVAFLWLSGLALYLSAKARSSNSQDGGQYSLGKLHLHIAGLFIAIFSVGVFPFFLITNRGEQLIIPSVILLISLFLASRHLGDQAKWGHKTWLIALYFIAVSLILYAHPKGIFLSPLFIIVGWQIFSHFKSRWAFIIGMALVGLHIMQDIAALKYAFKCSEVPQFESMLNSFSFDPLSLFYDPQSFFGQAYNSWQHFPKYLQQLVFQEYTDIDYLPAQPLSTFALYANSLIKINILVGLIALIFLIPVRYYRKDYLAGRYVSINLVLLVLFGCALVSATFNIPKNWYDAGYLYSLFLIIIIFFVGENFSGIFQKASARNIIMYLGAVALLSQAVLIQRNLPAFLMGYAGPSVSIAKYDSVRTINDLAAASRACNIDPVQSKRIVVDDDTYLYFQKSKWPMAITYIWAGNDDKSIRQFFAKVDSDGLVVNCMGILPSYMPFAKREGNICCIPKDKLKMLMLLP